MRVSVYYWVMTRPVRPFTALPWTSDLVAVLGDTMAAIGALDARISASSVASAWRIRASWAGYATALRLQRFEIDEIDVFSALVGLPIPHRPPVATMGEPFATYSGWLRSLGDRSEHHWREALPFSFEEPEGWSSAPTLLRALGVLDLWSRRDATINVWLAFPALCARMGLTSSPLPSLALGDPALRTLHGPRVAQLRRLLKTIRENCEDGLARLDRLEKWRRDFAAVIAGELRPGQLEDLGKLALTTPAVSARGVSNRLGMTVSGAGKLLARAAERGFFVEVPGRTSWRVYITSEAGIALGILAAPRGRPPSPPPPSPGLDAVLCAFDREMEAIDRLLEKG